MSKDNFLTGKLSIVRIAITKEKKQKSRTIIKCYGFSQSLLPALIVGQENIIEVSASASWDKRTFDVKVKTCDARMNHTAVIRLPCNRYIICFANCTTTCNISVVGHLQVNCSEVLLYLMHKRVVFVSPLNRKEYV